MAMNELAWHTYLMDVGRRVRARRLELSLSSTDMAMRTGVGRTHIYRIERGTVVMSMRTLLAICRVLGTTPDALLLPCGDDDEEMAA